MNKLKYFLVTSLMCSFSHVSAAQESGETTLEKESEKSPSQENTVFVPPAVLREEEILVLEGSATMDHT